MRFVVDASVAVKWLVAEEDSDIAEHLLDGRYELFAPRHMASEIGNALWRKVRVGEIGPRQAGALAAAIPDMAVEWADDEGISPDAVRLAVALDRSVYDCAYLALAHRLGATLVTADTHFVNALSDTEHGASVIALESLYVE